ncbi:hypothetical protein BH09PSE1_BH09PSE1_29850 [soil metagenome]
MVDASLFSSLTRRPDDRRRAAILIGSVALHVAVLGVIGLGLAGERLSLPSVEDVPVFLQMEPRPLLQGETARVPTPARIRATETRPLTGARPDILAPRHRQEDETPSPPAPRAAAAGASGTGVPVSPAEANPWTYRPETQGAAVARSLRTGAGGCRVMDGHLSASEQALCDDRFNAGAADAAGRHPLGARTQTASEQRRNEEFAREGAAALRRYEARRAPLTGGVGIMGPADCVGSNLGTGCAGAHLDPSMREGAQTLIRSPSARQGYQPLPGHHDD